MFARRSIVPALAGLVAAQQPGTIVQEVHPKLNLYECTNRRGCEKQELEVVMDASWRWVHGPEYKNCFDEDGWNKKFCPDGLACAQTCEMEGLGLGDYEKTYGVKTKDNYDTLELDFMTKGGNVGSRVYMMDSPTEYKMFKLLNREFTMEVSVEQLRCGMNGAVYFIEMDRAGGIGKGANLAGAKYGTGYCDAQCPHSKWIEGEANVPEATAPKNATVGKTGICCAEMDIWEANRESAAYTPHPCNIEGPVKCEGTPCGDGPERFDGLCDKDGCDFNSYRMGHRSFYGHGLEYVVDSSRPVQVVTQFHTKDGTDKSELVRIERFYVQDGRVIDNSHSMIAGVSGNSITDDFCSKQKSAFYDPNDFEDNGGMKQMGLALERGMVLALSLWDDGALHMRWLDSVHLGPNKTEETIGVHRGPCEYGEGDPEKVRSKYSDASVRFSKIKVGEIGSTFRGARRLADGVFV
mmetsp:Transcript_116234/g.309187  ORF Transcript_116234/g.309187 Transcript_116234/m.309187 type:complete len:465 (-) Transcript_116234:59-1453(-)